MDFLKKILQVATGQYASFFVEMFASILLVRTLGPENYGVYTVAYLLPNTIATFGSLNMGPALVYFMNREKLPVRGLFFTMLALALVIGAVCYLGFYLSLDFIQTVYLKHKVPNAFLLIAMLLAPSLLIEKFVRGILKGLYRVAEFTVIVQFFPSVLRLLLVLVLLYAHRLGMAAAMWIPVLVHLAVVLVLVLALRKNFFYSEIGGRLFVRFQDIKRILSFALKGHLGGLIQKSNNQIAMLIMTAFLEPISLGFFNLAIQLASLVAKVEAALDTVVAPKLAISSRERIREFFPVLARMVIALLLVMGLAASAAVPFFVFHVYGHEFKPVIPIFWIALSGFIFLAFISSANALFTQSGRPLVKSVIRGCGLAFNVILLMILLPHFGLLGAAFAISGSYLVMFAVSVWFVKKHLSVGVTELLILRAADVRLLLDNLRNLAGKPRLRSRPLRYSAVTKT